jgi:tRNA 2-thiouridine synthesizing protein D
MNYALLILASPYSSPGAKNALHFAEAALSRGHTLSRVFFYHDGVFIGNALSTPPQDEHKLLEEWVALAENNSVELIACIGASLRRGVLDTAEAERYDKPVANLHPAFVLSGLGQLVDTAITADRLITFSGN